MLINENVQKLIKPYLDSYGTSKKVNKILNDIDRLNKRFQLICLKSYTTFKMCVLDHAIQKDIVVDSNEKFKEIYMRQFTIAFKQVSQNPKPKKIQEEAKKEDIDEEKNKDNEETKQSNKKRDIKGASKKKSNQQHDKKVPVMKEFI